MAKLRERSRLRQTFKDGVHFRNCDEVKCLIFTAVGAGAALLVDDPP